MNNRTGFCLWAFCFLFLFTCYHPHSTFAQKEDNIWVFGDSATIDFSSGSPIAATVTPGFFAWEGCASISDAAGNLLLYSDGLTLYGRNHLPLPDGANLLPSDPESTSQASVICPVPGSDSLYLVFCLEEAWSPGGGLYYSLVDMSLNGGIGDIVPGKKMILLGSDLTEKMTVTATCDQIWLMTRSRYVNQYKAYRITSTGISTAPVVSAIGGGELDDYQRGIIRFSPDGKKMAAAIRTYTSDKPSLELYDFDQATGMLSNVVPLDGNYLLGNSNYYSVCFSPDNSKLYGTAGLFVNQFNLDAGTSAAVKASRTIIGTTAAGYDIRQGPDQKLYIAATSTAYLHSIEEPNLSGTACTFIANSISLPGGAKSTLGLPNTVIAFSAMFKETISREHDTLACGPFELGYALSGAKPLWNTGATTATIGITASGTYWRQYIRDCIRYADTFEVSFITPPLLDLGKDSVICEGAALWELKADVPAAFSIAWSTGSTAAGIVPPGAGLYWAKVSNEACSITDSIHIEEKVCGCGFNVPSAFSPNGDGNNDIFLPVIASGCSDIDHYALSVFNRWGERVYHTNKATQGWDGLYQGQPADVGTYFYEVHFKKGSQENRKKGDLVLLR